jgi:hypothetical protein
MRGGWWVEDDGWIRGLLILLELAVRIVEDAKIPFIELDMLTGRHYLTQLAFNVVSMMIMKMKYALQTRSVQNGQTPALYPFAPCQT